MMKKQTIALAIGACAFISACRQEPPAEVAERDPTPSLPAAARETVSPEPQAPFSDFTPPIHIKTAPAIPDGGTLHFDLTDANGRTLVCCRDGRMQHSTGNLFVGAYHPERAGARELERGGPEERALVALLDKWLAQHFTADEIRRLAGPSFPNGVEEKEGRQVRLIDGHRVAFVVKPIKTRWKD